MSSLDPSGSRPLKIAGIALLGVAGLAAVVGLVTLGTGEPKPTAGGGASVTATAPAPAGTTASSTTAASTTSSAPPTTTVSSTTGQPGPTGVPGGPGVGQPGPGQPGPGQPGGQPVARPDVRVYNNSTIKGLANRAADDLRANGWTVPEVGNYPSGVLTTTTVFFRPGTPEEAAAHELGAELGAKVAPRFEGIQNASPGVILIVTNDYKGFQAKQ